MEVVNIHQAKTNLSALIQKVLNGDKVIIARNNEPVAELVPLIKEKKKRKAGTLRGKISPIDAWSETDKEIEEMFYNSSIFIDEQNTD